jgi:CDP-diacylglycerol pyrophosphatase
LQIFFAIIKPKSTEPGPRFARKSGGHRFVAMKIETDSLAKVDPFKLLPRSLPSTKASMGHQTLAAIGATFRDGKSGFYLLANDARASPRDTVSAEALLDDKCAN